MLCLYVFVEWADSIVLRSRLAARITNWLRNVLFWSNSTVLLVHYTPRQNHWSQPPLDHPASRFWANAFKIWSIDYISITIVFQTCRQRKTTAADAAMQKRWCSIWAGDSSIKSSFWHCWQTIALGNHQRRSITIQPSSSFSPAASGTPAGVPGTSAWSFIFVRSPCISPMFQQLLWLIGG